MDKVNQVGRPLKFDTPEKLREAINKYFQETEHMEYTVTGLALAIGTTRETLDDYQQREGYKEIVKEAKLIVENSYELSLRRNSKVGDIFALKNFGWKDKREVEHMGKMTLTDLVDEEANGDEAGESQGNSET